jgi:hypothetical protein
MAVQVRIKHEKNPFSVVPVHWHFWLFLQMHVAFSDTIKGAAVFAGVSSQ